jgi:Predicted membrane protein
VPESAAGKKIRCPKCKGAIEVPAAAVPEPIAEREQEVEQSAIEPPQNVPVIATQSDQWYLKTEEGDQYGPVSRDELDAWKEEGRITAECQLLAAGSTEWQWAGDVYPDLDGEPHSAAAAAVPTPTARKSTPLKKAFAAKKSVPSPAKDDDADAPSSRSKAIAGLLGIFLGPLGIHRFYLGYWGLGLAMLLTLGGCGVWSLIDAALVLLGRVNDADGRRLSD